MQGELVSVFYTIFIGVLLMAYVSNLFFYIQMGKSYIRAYLFFIIAILSYLFLVYTHTFGLTQFETEDFWSKVIQDVLFVPLVYTFYAYYINTYFKVIFDIPSLFKRINCIAVLCAICSIVPFFCLLIGTPKTALICQFFCQIWLVVMGLEVLWKFKKLFIKDANSYFNHLYIGALFIVMFNISYYFYVFCFFNIGLVFNPFHFIAIAFFIDIFISSNANAEHYKQLNLAIQKSEEKKMQYLKQQETIQYKLLNRKKLELNQSIEEVLVNNKKLMEASYKEKLDALKGKLIATSLDINFVESCFKGINQMLAANQKEEALQYIDVFAGYLRALLNASIEETTLLSEEVNMINQYYILNALSSKQLLKFQNIDIEKRNTKIKSLVLFNLLIESEKAIKLEPENSSLINLHIQLEHTLEDDFGLVYTHLKLEKIQQPTDSKQGKIFLTFKTD